MQVELRAIKHHKSLSQETAAFTAELWVNGKLAGTVQNTGQGEGNYPRWIDEKLAPKVGKYMESLPPKATKYGGLSMTLDFYIALLVEADLQRSMARTMLQRNQVFTDGRKVFKGKRGVNYKLAPGQRVVTDEAELVALLAAQG